MKTPIGKLIQVAFAVGFFGLFLSGRWDEFVQAYPDATAWDFALSLVPYLGAVLVGIVVFAALLAVARKVNAHFAPPQNPSPPADAGPLYALRTYPVHVGICVGMVVSSVVLYFFWPVAAMLAVGPTIGAWVLLGRRLGFEPANDPAAPHNPMRT